MYKQNENIDNQHLLDEILELEKEILSRLSLVRVYDDFVGGVSLEEKRMVSCPLHDEDTPSFRYYPETDTFYCFGCQKGGKNKGNLVYFYKFLQESREGRKISYITAMYELATHYNLGREIIDRIKKLRDNRKVIESRDFLLKELESLRDIRLKKQSVCRDNIDNSKKIVDNEYAIKYNELKEKFMQVLMKLNIDKLRLSKVLQDRLNERLNCLDKLLDSSNNFDEIANNILRHYFCRYLLFVIEKQREYLDRSSNVYNDIEFDNVKIEDKDKLIDMIFNSLEIVQNL